MVSGQAPEPADPGRLPDLRRLRRPGTDRRDGQAVGARLRVSRAVQTIGNQLDRERPELEGLHAGHGQRPHARAATCGHPALELAGRDADGPARRRLRGAPRPLRLLPLDHRRPGATAHAHVVSLDGAGRATCSKAATTPSLSYIAPNLCDDGHDYPCTNEPTPARAQSTTPTAFLATWVPRITCVARVQEGRLARDHLRRVGRSADATRRPAATRSPARTRRCPASPGWAAAGSAPCLLSPYIKPGTVSSTPYNHYGAARRRSRTCSGCRGSATRPPPRQPSAGTSTRDEP